MNRAAAAPNLTSISVGRLDTFDCPAVMAPGHSAFKSFGLYRSVCVRQYGLGRMTFGRQEGAMADRCHDPPE